MHTDLSAGIPLLTRVHRATAAEGAAQQQLLTEPSLAVQLRDGDGGVTRTDFMSLWTLQR